MKVDSNWLPTWIAFARLEKAVKKTAASTRRTADLVNKTCDYVDTTVKYVKEVTWKRYMG